MRIRLTGNTSGISKGLLSYSSAKQTLTYLSATLQSKVQWQNCTVFLWNLDITVKLFFLYLFREKKTKAGGFFSLSIPGSLSKFQSYCKIGSILKGHTGSKTFITKLQLNHLYAPYQLQAIVFPTL